MQTEENNRMGKTRDLFKKIRDMKETFHPKVGMIRERNAMDLTEAEDIKRWQEYIEEVYKKDLTLYATAKETQMYRTVFWTLWERARVGWFGRMALKHV